MTWSPELKVNRGGGERTEVLQVEGAASAKPVAGPAGEVGGICKARVAGSREAETARQGLGLDTRQGCPGC